MISILADTDVGFGEFLVWVISIFAFVLFFWMLFVVLGDLFSRHDTSGWAKAAWVIFVIFLPLLGILVYLVTQGHGMALRGQKAQEARVQALRQTVGYSGADELAKLKKLHSEGTLSDSEYARLKAQVVEA